MDSGEQYPFISRKSVRSALDMLLYSASAQRISPLERLLIVDVFLTDPDLPPGPYTREFALQQLLTAVISDNYSHLRIILRLQPPEATIPLDDAINELTNDLRRGNTELSGWSLLYYRYIRTDLNMTLEAMSEVLFLDQRTLRRYVQSAIDQLTEKLMAAEWSARIQQRKRRLITELPALVPVLLFGRDDALRQVKDLLRQPPPHHIQVTGTAGIGKTAFVQEVIREEIETEQLEHVVWINRPESVQYIRRYLTQRLLPESSTIDLREYTLMKRVAIVLDDLQELLENETAALEEFLDYSGAALVLFTSRIHIPLRNSPVHISLPELSKEDALSLLRANLGTRYLERLNLDTISAIFEASGGNPLVIKLTAQNETLHPVDSLVLDSLFAQIYGGLDRRLKRAWFMFALLPHDPVDVTALYKLWPSWISITDVSSLVRHHLIELRSQQPTTCVLMTSARHFIQLLYECDTDARGLINNLIASLDRIPDQVVSVLSVVEHILLSHWLNIRPELQKRLINDHWQEGVKLGRWSKWCEILEVHSLLSEATIELQLAYGICLRHLSEWVLAEQIFQQVVQRTGGLGLFVVQAQSLLELSILFRYHGYYENALAILSQIEALMTRIPNHTLIEDLKLEYAQIAIEKGDGSVALQYLNDIELGTKRLVLMKSEAYMLVGEHRRSIMYANQTVEASHQQGQVEARAYSIIGRSYVGQGDWQAALPYLGFALTILEQGDDPFALARAQANLGALLIQFGDYEEARQLLRLAERIQTRLADQPALAATQHNLRLLEIAASKVSS